MHYLSLLTIRMYTLVSVLFTNGLPDWLQHSLRSLTVVRIPFDRSNWDSLNQSTISSLYGDGHTGTSSVVNFYINFSKYLKTTNPTFSIFRSMGGHVAEWMYEIANALQNVYIYMFGIFSNVTKPDTTIGYFFKYTKYVGWTAFTVLLVIYGIGMIFNIQGGFSRMKDLILGMLMALGVLVILPSLTNGFVGGMQKTVTSILGNPNTGTANNALTYQDPKSKDKVLPTDEIVKNNIVSIPNMTTYAALHHQNTIDLGNNSKAFQKTGQAFSSSVPAQPYNINLYKMGDNPNSDITHRRDIWNGIGQSDVATFLSGLGSDGSYLDHDTVNNEAGVIRKNLGTQNFYDSGQYKTVMDVKGIFEWLTPGSKQVEGIANYIINHHNRNENAEDVDNDIATQIYAPYMYQVRGSGDSAQLSMLKQFSKDNSDILAAFHTSYAKYQVNWMNVFTGLGSLIAILLGLIFKLTNSFFKMVVMYATSGWFLLKNSADHNKIKDFVRTFFGIFENLIMDLIVLRLFLTTYFDISATVQNMPISPLTMGLIQPFIAYGLFKVESKGIDTLSSQMSGKNTQSGHGLGAIGAAGAAWLGAKTVGNGAKTGVRNAGHGAKKGAIGAANLGSRSVGGWQHQKAQAHPGYQPGGITRGLRNEAGQLTGNTSNTSQRTSSGGSQGQGSEGSTGSNGSDSGSQSSGNDDKTMNSQSAPQTRNPSFEKQNDQGHGSTSHHDNHTNLNGSHPNDPFTKKLGSSIGFMGRKAAAGVSHSAINPKNYSWPGSHYFPHFDKQRAKGISNNDQGAENMKNTSQRESQDHGQGNDDKKGGDDPNDPK